VDTSQDTDDQVLAAKSTIRHTQLWMVMLNAVRCNPWLRQYYERLRGVGKPGKVAVIAAMRKLLAAAWSVAKHRRPFLPRLSTELPQSSPS
jgi:hypothetical protein